MCSHPDIKRDQSNRSTQDVGQTKRSEEMCEGEPGGLGGIEGTKWQMICLVKVFIDIFF